MSQVRISEKKRGRGGWAAIGFILIIACGIIAAVITPSVVEFLDDQVRGFRITGRDLQQTRLIVGFIVFLLLTSVAALIVAVFAPKRAINVKETDLIKEREMAQKARKSDRMRQRQINREYRDHLEGKTSGGKKKR
jgi:predicted PurR-regulated permease PerM